MNQLCNAYGLDTIETGGTLGVAMEAGVLEFGDSKGAIQLIHNGQRFASGRTLEALAITGKILRRRAHLRSKDSMPAYEPRAVKGIGITYATTNMELDHSRLHHLP